MGKKRHIEMTEIDSGVMVPMSLVHRAYESAHHNRKLALITPNRETMMTRKHIQHPPPQLGTADQAIGLARFRNRRPREIHIPSLCA
jgi:hypothetical protein